MLILARIMVVAYVAGLAVTALSIVAFMVLGSTCQSSACTGPVLASLILLFYGVGFCLVTFPFAFAAMKYLERGRD